MSKAVQRPVLDRDKAGQADKVRFPWQPRLDGKSAILTSERSTVFDRRAPGLEPADPIDKISDPLWRETDDDGRLQWTPDLVHARLLLVGDVLRRMPAPLRKSYVSVLGSIALTEISSTKRATPTPEEISLTDWTLVEIMQRAHRQVMLASAFGYSGDKIAQALQAHGRRISGSTVQAIYLNERRIMAGQWQAKRVQVDQLTADRCEQVFARRRK